MAARNHIEAEEPRVIFLHYWGVGSTADLAQALKDTLDAQKDAPKG